MPTWMGYKEKMLKALEAGVFGEGREIKKAPGEGPWIGVDRIRLITLNKIAKHVKRLIACVLDFDKTEGRGKSVYKGKGGFRVRFSFGKYRDGTCCEIIATKCYDDVQSFSDLVSVLSGLGVISLANCEINLLFNGDADEIRNKLFLNGMLGNLDVSDAYVVRDKEKFYAKNRDRVSSFLRVYNVSDGVGKIELQISKNKKRYVPLFVLFCSEPLVRALDGMVKVYEITEIGWEWFWEEYGKVKGKAILEGKCEYEVIKYLRKKGYGLKRLSKARKYSSVFEKFGEPVPWVLPKPRITYEVGEKEVVFRIPDGSKYCVNDIWNVTHVNIEMAKFYKKYWDEIIKRNERAVKESQYSDAAFAIRTGKQVKDERRKEQVRKLEKCIDKLKWVKKKAKEENGIIKLSKQVAKKVAKEVKETLSIENLHFAPLLIPTILGIVLRC